ncbi:MAG: BON domain-containing protein, partial [Thermoanaerobaculia bacterium]
EVPVAVASPAPQAPPPSAGALPESPLGTAATAEDAAITVEVRRRLEGAAPARRIQVSTRRGVVTLSGAVDTEQEKSEALEAARKTPGVSRVEDRLVVLVS